MYRKVVLLLIVILSVAILLFGVKIDKELAEMTRMGAQDYVSEDESGASEFEFTHYDEGTHLKIYRISGRSMDFHRDGTMDIIRPRIVFYSGTQENNELLTVSADRGVYYPREEKRTGLGREDIVEARGILRGDVILETSEGVRAYLGAAAWSGKTRKITAEGPIVIESPDFSIYGEDLEARARRDADEIVIRKDVRAVFDRQEDTSLGRVFAGEERATPGRTRAGMVITCDGVMSYSAASEAVTFEEDVLVTGLEGSATATEAAETRKRWLETIAAGEEAILETSAEEAPLLFAGKSLAIKLRAGTTRAGYSSTSVRAFTALGDAWLVRSRERVNADRIEYTGDTLVLTGDPARLWHEGEMELEGQEFRIDGVTGGEQVAIRSEKPGVLRTDTASWTNPIAGRSGTGGKGSVHWNTRFRWDGAAGSAAFEGDVVVEDVSGTLRAQEVEIAFVTQDETRVVESMQARGEVRYEQQEPHRVAWADSIKYAREDGRVELAGGPNGLAGMEEGTDVLESQTIWIQEEDGIENLSGGGRGRLRIYEDLVDPRARETSLPTYDVRWKESCAVTQEGARFEGDVEMIKGRSRLRSSVLEMDFGGRDETGRAHSPSVMTATGEVTYDDLSGGEAVQALGDRLSFDFSTGIMRLESTAPYDEDLRMAPPEAMASVTFGSNRLSSRVIHYLKDEETSERLLWSQGPGVVQVKRMERKGEEEKLRERTELRCRGTILYAPPRRLAEVAQLAKISFGQGAMPSGLLAQAGPDGPVDVGVALFVDNVRVRQWSAQETGEELSLAFTLECNYLEAHFSSSEEGKEEKDAEPLGGNSTLSRMAAGGDVEVIHKKRYPETRATGETLIWRSDPRRQWYAELRGAPARIEEDRGELAGEKVILWGYPAEIYIDRAPSAGATVR